MLCRTATALSAESYTVTRRLPGWGRSSRPVYCTSFPLNAIGKARNSVSSWGQSKPSPRYCPVATTTRSWSGGVAWTAARSRSRAFLASPPSSTIGCAAASLGERGEHVVADQRGPLLVVDQGTEHRLDGRTLSAVRVSGDVELGRSDAELQRQPSRAQLGVTVA